MATELMTIHTQRATVGEEAEIPAARLLLPDWSILSGLVDTGVLSAADKKKRQYTKDDSVVSYLELYNEVRRTEVLLQCWRDRVDNELYRNENVQTRLKWNCTDEDNCRSCHFHNLIWPEYRISEDLETERCGETDDHASVRMIEFFARSVQIFFYCFATKARFARQKTSILRLRNWLEGLAVPELKRAMGIDGVFPDELVVVMLRSAYPSERFAGGATLDVHSTDHGMRILERAYRKKLYYELRRVNDNIGTILNVVKTSRVVNILMKIVDMKSDFSKITGLL